MPVSRPGSPTLSVKPEGFQFAMSGPKTLPISDVGSAESTARMDDHRECARRILPCNNLNWWANLLRADCEGFEEGLHFELF